jgi:hypothetical protein
MALADSNFFGRALTELMKRLKAKVTALNWIAEDLGQLEESTMRPAVNFPCALVDFPNTTYQDLVDNRQQGLPNITIRLGFDPYTTSHGDLPDDSLQQSLKRFEIEQQVIDALNGWEVEGLFQRLARINVTTEKRGDGMRVRIITFTTLYQDEYQAETYNTVNSPSVKISFKKD